MVSQLPNDHGRRPIEIVYTFRDSCLESPLRSQVNLHQAGCADPDHHR